MTKEQLKRYLEEAVEALDANDINLLFPDTRQPDLYSIAEELIGLRGEVKRLNQSSLKVTNEVQAMMDSFRIAREEAEQQALASSSRVEKSEIDSDLKELLKGIINQDIIQKRTSDSLENLPPLNLTFLFKFKEQFAAWQQGYLIGQQQWNQLMKSIGLMKTGLIGSYFDPNYHEAIAVQELSNEPNNIILETEVIGYLYKNQLVQRAKVVVNKTFGGMPQNYG